MKTKKAARSSTGKRVKDALGGHHEGKKDGFLLDPDKVTLVDDRGSALYDDRVHEKPDESMVLNIMAVGVHTPIVVRRNAETGDIEVVAGRRRVINNREANKRLRAKGIEPRWIPAVVKRGEAADLFDILTSENEARKADSPLNRARKMQRMLDLGRDEGHVAKMFCCSAGTVRNTLSLLDLPKDVQKSLERGTLAPSDAYKMKGLEPDAQKQMAEKLAVEAPKDGQKRRSNASKAREIVNGAPSMLGKRAITAKIDDLECLAAPEAKGAVNALRWVLGEQKELQVSP
jgi:ParB family transcriptional regulator, chromosome partitioning protein